MVNCCNILRLPMQENHGAMVSAIWLRDQNIFNSRENTAMGQHHRFFIAKKPTYALETSEPTEQNRPKSTVDYLTVNLRFITVKMSVTET
jgi:hypothetical protein